MIGYSLVTLVFDAPRLKLDADNPPTIAILEVLAPVLVLALVVVDGDVNVVEDVVVVGAGVVPADHTGVLGVAFLVHVTAHREASATVVLSVLHGVAPGHWHVVHDPVVLVVHEHSFTEQSDLLLIVRIIFLVILGTEDLAIRVLQELDLIGRGSDSLSEHNLAQVLSRGVVFICFAEVKTRNIDENMLIISLLLTY